MSLFVSTQWVTSVFCCFVANLLMMDAHAKVNVCGIGTPMKRKCLQLQCIYLCGRNWSTWRKQLQECLWARCSRTFAINVACSFTTVFVLLETVFFFCHQSVWRRELQVLPRSSRKHQCCWQHFFCNGFFMIQHQLLMKFLKIQDHHLNWLFIWLRLHKYILNPCSGP